ncbi:EamA family transporter [Paradesulfitobacterium ferrireducens]|uniref:EamA family transporter n=1 Tax=Paradesulfitobacterium ferrireducens TaxID=2816476 RepID=UPI001A8DC8E9|nr:EamA family transporter [Paradesulfitobacterium ferrireducens]
MAVDLRSLGIAFVSILLGATGQFLLKLGMMHFKNITAGGIWGQLINILLTPAIFIGFACFGVSSVLWLVVLSRWELSVAYPMVSLGYVLAFVLAAVFLHESFSLPKIIGSAFILLGISILGLFGRS